MKKRLFILLLLFFISLIGFSQTSDSIGNYNEAIELYNQGKYNDALSIVNKLLKDRRFMIFSSKNDLEKIYILLTQIHIELKNYSEVTDDLIQLLINNPTFYPNAKLYQEDFYNYYNKIDVHPQFLVGVQFGASIPIYRTHKVYSVYDSVNYSNAYKRNKVKGTKCYSGGLSLQWDFYKNFALLGTIDYAKTSLIRNITTSGTDEFNLKYSEISYSNDIGLSIKKYLYKVNESSLLTFTDGGQYGRGFGPYLSLGGYFSHLREAQGDVELIYLYTDRQSQYSETKKISSNNIDVKEMRNIQRWGVNFSLGSSLILNKSLLSFEVKYLYDLTHYTKEKNLYNNPELLYNYYYIDNDVLLSRLNISISFMPVFKHSVKSKIK